MKKILSVLVVCFGIMSTSEALPCSPAYGVLWPYNQATGLPLNTILDVIYTKDLSMEESNSGTVVPLENISGTDSRKQYRPSQLLKPNTEYKIKFDKQERTFTTGPAEDKEPPEVAASDLSVKVEYAEDREYAELMLGGMCGPHEYKVAELDDDYREYADKLNAYLPEHYNVIIELKKADGQTDETYFNVSEMASDGSVIKEVEDSGSYISLPRINASEATGSKTYRLIARDRLGNIKPEPIYVNINFAKAQSTFSVSDKPGDVAPPPPPEPEPSPASGGCSLITEAKTK